MALWRAPVVLLLALGLGQEPSAPQDEVERLFKAAVEGRVVVRPQAARRLIELGPAGEGRILRELGEGGRGLAALGAPVVESLGSAEDSRLRDALWNALVDRDFPWRPSAARAVVEHPLASDAAGLARLASDVLAEVRTAAAQGLDCLDAPAASFEAALADQDDRVRRAAAAALARRDDGRGAWLLFEELAREDNYFERPTGANGRRLAARQLEALSIDLFQLAVEGSPSDSANEAARAKLAAQLTARFGPPPALLPWQSAGRKSEGEVIGLELRSCRTGEGFLRWTADDSLLVGLGQPARVALPRGTVEGLLRLHEQALTQLGDQRSFGTPGCDLEQLLVRLRGQATSSLLVVKGPEPVANLRPAALTAPYLALLATLPDEEAADPRLDRLRTRVRAMLASLGGPLSEGRGE